MFGQIGTLGGKTSEDETFVRVDTSDGRKSQVKLATAAVTLGMGIPDEVARVAEVPPMVGTPKAASISRRCGADLVAAVRTAIE